MKPKLSKIEKVDLREVWETEDKHFTPWLAEDENISQLGEAIGIDLEVEALSVQTFSLVTPQLTTTFSLRINLKSPTISILVK